MRELISAKKKKKALAGNELSNTLPKFSHAGKKATTSLRQGSVKLWKHCNMHRRLGSATLLHWLSPGKATQIFHGRNPNGTIQL